LSKLPTVGSFPTKASVEAETSTIINKRLLLMNFRFELVYRSTCEYIQNHCWKIC